MAKVYVSLIIKGLRTFDSVPEDKKEEVRKLLIDMGREDLIGEEKPLNESEE